MAKILVIEGERSIRNTLKERLEYEGYRVDIAETIEEASGKCNENDYDAILFSMQTPGKDMLGCLGQFKISKPLTPVIVLSTVKSIDSVVEVMKLGAYDFISKPIDLNRLLASVRTAVEKKEEAYPVNYQAYEGGAMAESFSIKIPSHSTPLAEEIIGQSECIKQVKNIIDKVAPSDARVLITGDNGTGKELVARSLHYKSSRSGAPFVEVNCAAIPSELIESELFGHEKGAFTSAIKNRKGKFEQADGGTLFLDEIGDMSLSAQAKVLRVLQEQKITRVGSDKDVHVDVRVIAATNKNLQNEIFAHNFREDLYHRLSVIVIRVPALRERLDDIPLLAQHFTAQICKEYNTPVKNIDSDAIKELLEMEWSGNIRELRNVVERLIILSEKSITKNDVQKYAVGIV